jgi:hypothetical protein
MSKNTRFSPEIRQLAVRIVLENQNEYHSQWAPLAPLSRRLAAHQRPYASGFASMSGLLTESCLRYVMNKWLRKKRPV